MWLEFGQIKYHYDENFMAVSNYVKSLSKDDELTRKLVK
jgi:hypothetical protein